jgi:hypothetical protein
VDYDWVERVQQEDEVWFQPSKRYIGPFEAEGVHILSHGFNGIFECLFIVFFNGFNVVVDSVVVIEAQDRNICLALAIFDIDVKYFEITWFD